jgi:hypothetical protein
MGRPRTKQEVFTYRTSSYATKKEKYFKSKQVLKTIVDLTHKMDAEADRHQAYWPHYYAETIRALITNIYPLIETRTK